MDENGKCSADATLAISQNSLGPLCKDPGPVLRVVRLYSSTFSFPGASGWPASRGFPPLPAAPAAPEEPPGGPLASSCPGALWIVGCSAVPSVDLSLWLLGWGGGVPLDMVDPSLEAETRQRQAEGRHGTTDAGPDRRSVGETL